MYANVGRGGLEWFRWLKYVSSEHMTYSLSWHLKLFLCMYSLWVFKWSPRGNFLMWYAGKRWICVCWNLTSVTWRSNWLPFTAVKGASGASELSSVDENFRSLIRSPCSVSLAHLMGLGIGFPLPSSSLLSSLSQFFQLQPHQPPCASPPSPTTGTISMFTCGALAATRAVGRAWQLCSDVWPCFSREMDLMENLVLFL